MKTRRLKRLKRFKRRGERGRKEIVLTNRFNFRFLIIDFGKRHSRFKIQDSRFKIQD